METFHVSHLSLRNWCGTKLINLHVHGTVMSWARLQTKIIMLLSCQDLSSFSSVVEFRNIYNWTLSREKICGSRLALASSRKSCRCQVSFGYLGKRLQKVSCQRETWGCFQIQKWLKLMKLIRRISISFKYHLGNKSRRWFKIKHGDLTQMYQ